LAQVKEGVGMNTVTVTIGRNVGEKPLPPADWTSFRAAVRQAVETVGAEIYVDSTGRGRWGEVWEDNAIIHAGDVDSALVPALRRTLASLAAIYGQDAIGLAVGTGEVGGAEP